jgi:tetratricopeptide (TPR) repeat protein
VRVCHPSPRESSIALTDRYTRKEASRIVGSDVQHLRYWERLHLVHPRARWGERFYTFSDLLALRTIKQLTDKKVPALRVQKALAAIGQEIGVAEIPLDRLQLMEHARQVIVLGAGMFDQPFNPLSGQWLLPFPLGQPPATLHQMEARTAAEWFETALACEAKGEQLPEAIYSYQQVVRLAPEWIEAHINLGVAHYQLAHWEEARQAFLAAVKIDPSNPMARYNLGCVLEEMGEIADAIVQLKRAVRGMPAHADAHFNLALAYEKIGEDALAKEHWAFYLKYDPNGMWVDTARARLTPPDPQRRASAPIPFPKRKS